ncbi:hypothetical protein [Burkholderia sp. MBR-1]|uniref:hypothetical protein n=1 Tax=Burkholderia sp. MBR-1 TaxID=2732364 RepID=UPI0015EF2C4A|nr:hypothetical protein [Burkholderia sp. MBR-1]QMI49768.1 hypothetical protein MBR110_30300 [Burkholderia sp. MBR-1]
MAISVHVEPALAQGAAPAHSGSSLSHRSAHEAIGSFQIRHPAMTALASVLTLDLWPAHYGSDAHDRGAYSDGWTKEQLDLLLTKARPAFEAWRFFWRVVLIGAFISAFRKRLRQWAASIFRGK